MTRISAFLRIFNRFLEKNNVRIIVVELIAIILCLFSIASLSLSHISELKIIEEKMQESSERILAESEEASARTSALAEIRKKEYEEKTASKWKGPVLSKSRGTVNGPSGKETYYNLNMSGVVKLMHRLGYSGEYWVRDDGCKMLGDYIMVAANLSLRPRGTLVETSLGMGIVCDTGGFAKRNKTQIDIATNW